MIRNCLPRYDLEITHLRFGVGAAVCFYEAHDDVQPLPLRIVRVSQHRVGLAHAGCGTDVDPQARSLRRLHARKDLLAAQASFGLHVAIV